MKSVDGEAKTAKRLLEDKKLDYLYLMKGETKGGIAEKEKIYTVSLCLVDRMQFNFEKG